MALSRTEEGGSKKVKNLNIIAVVPAWLTWPTNCGEKTRKPRRTRVKSLSSIFTKSVLVVVNDSFLYSNKKNKIVVFKKKPEKHPLSL